MATRVGIVDVAMTPGAESKDNFLDQVYKVTKEVLDKAEAVPQFIINTDT